MKDPDFKTFGQWLSNRMEVVQISPHAFASCLDHENSSYINQVCNNQARLHIKDWPSAAKFLQLRLDELLIVLDYFHPDWVTEYDAFISNCLRYLMWRIEQSQPQDRSWPEQLLSITLEEVVEPACTGRFDTTEDRRKTDRRKNKMSSEQEKRVQPRRLTDLIHYLKSQRVVIALFTLWASGPDLMHGWGL